MNTVINKSIPGSKLYYLLGDFNTFSHFSVDRVSTKDASNLAFLVWPNGSPCLIGNMYLLSLLDRRTKNGKVGLSRRGKKGGSIGDYAAKISQLLKKCYRDCIDPININDGLFSDYVEEMTKETSVKNPQQTKKTSSSALATGRVWLDFLGYVGRFYGDKNFVSSEGIIRATEEKYVTVTRHGKRYVRTYLSHHSFPIERRVHRRNPVTDDDIARLRNANRLSKKSDFVKKRRFCMLELFECTGARRDEVSELTIDDIIRAKEHPESLLKLQTLKRGIVTEREIFVNRMVLHNVYEFYDKARRKVMRNKYKGGADHRMLFVSERTGKPLSSQTLTNEMTELKNLSGIQHQICIHMFRHAFITKKFLQMIREHEISNADEFRRALIDVKTFITEIQQWTGQMDSASVEHYIHLAFRDLSQYTTTIRSVHLNHSMEIFFKKQKELTAMLKEGMDVDEYVRNLEELERLANEDFEISKRAESLLSKKRV